MPSHFTMFSDNLPAFYSVSASKAPSERYQISVAQLGFEAGSDHWPVRWDSGLPTGSRLPRQEPLRPCSHWDMLIQEQCMVLSCPRTVASMQKG